MSELPMGWAAASIGDLVDINPKQSFEDALIAGFVSMSHAPTDMLGKARFEQRPWGEIKKGYTHFQDNDVIFAKVTPCFENGKAALLSGLPNGFGAGSTEFFVLRPIAEGINQKYLLALIKSHDFLQQGAENMTGAVGLRRVPKQFVERYTVPVPPLAEQTRITQKLDELLAQVDTLKARLDAIPTQLKRFRQSTLAAAVSGRLTADWRAEQARSDGNEHLSPTHKFRDIYQLIDGDRGPNYPKQNDYEPKGYCLFLSTKNVRPSGFLLNELTFISKEKHLQLRSGKAEIGDVILTTRGTLGNVALYDKKIATIYPIARINSGMLIIREHSSGKVIPTYLRLFIESPLFSVQLAEKQTGSAQPQIPAGILKDFDINVPTIEEQTEIVRRVEQLFSFADQLEAKIKTAQARVNHLTQSILAKAFRGELVPQDPNDEPASAPLERLKAQRAAAPKAKRGRKSA